MQLLFSSISSSPLVSQMDATTAGDLESEALKRKKRIEALRQLKEQKQQDGKEPSQPLPG